MTDQKYIPDYIPNTDANTDATPPSPRKKNLKLSHHLTGAWKDFDIEKIERIETGPDHGWQVTYRI